MRKTTTLRAAALAGSAALALVGTSAEAAEVRFNIPPQDLSSALRAFGVQSGQPILFSGDAIDGVTSPGVQGAYEPADALKRLLGGAGATYSRAGSGFVVTPKAAPAKIIKAAAVSPTVETPPPAPAAAPIGVEEIVVTAQRREERLQDVPIAVTALSAEQLTNSGITTTQDLPALTPTLALSQNVGAFLPRLRGVGGSFTGAGIENSVATYVDGVYYAASPASIFSLAGVERIEVLKGPQGTLFGRNATGGLIQIVTKKPSETFGGTLSVNYGNYETLGADGYITGGLAPGLAMDFAFHASTQGEGYGTERFLNIDTNRTDRDIAFRSQMLYTGQRTTARLSADYSELEGSPSSVTRSPYDLSVFGPFLPGLSPWDGSANVPYRVHSKNYGLSLTVNHELPFADLVSITAGRYSELFSQQDTDKSPADALSVTISPEERTFSQELQLISKPDSPISWILGLYYYDGKAEYNPLDQGRGPVFAPVAIQRYITHQDTRSGAAFGQVTVPLGETTRATAGLRYTTDEKRFRGEQVNILANGGVVPVASRPWTRDSHDAITWRLSVDHHFTPDIMGYVSYNRGFKSGGFNSTAITAPPFEPEQLDAYEVGLKAEFFDRRVSFNPSLFYYDYRDLQITTFTNQGLPLFTNGESAEIYGLDLDFTARPVENLTIRGGLALIHHEFGDLPGTAFVKPNTPPVPGSVNTIGNGKGKRVPFTADWAATLAADYEIPVSFGKLTLSGTYNHSDGFYTAPDNLRLQKPYDLVNASVRAENHSGSLFVSLWGRNLLNEAVALYITGSTIGGSAQYQPPLTFGVTLGTKF
jgi:iron complex outermembrane recepter protein